MRVGSDKQDIQGAWLAAFWLVAFALMVVAATSERSNSDEFIFVLNAQRIAEGQIQSRDYFQYLMPGWLLLTGALFKLTGPSLFAARVLQAAFIAMTATCTLRLTRALGAGRGLALVAALVPLLALWGPAYQYSHRAFAQAFTLLALWLAWRALSREDARPWFWVGVAAGLTYATHQQDGAVVLAGVGLGALWQGWRASWPWPTTLRRAGCYLLGAFLPLCVLALYYAAHGVLAEMLWVTHVWPFTHYKLPGNHNDVLYGTDLGLAISPSPWVSRAYFYARLGTLPTLTFLPFLVPLAGLCWLIGLRRSSEKTPVLAFSSMLVWVATLSFLAALRARTDSAHLAGGFMPVLLLLVTATIAWERATCETVFRGLRWLPRLSLVAFMLASLTLRVEIARVGLPRNGLLVSPDATLKAHPTMVRLAQMLQPGDTLFAASQGGMYNFYLAPNPTRYDYWVRPEDGYTSPVQFAELLADIRAKRPRLLVVPARTRASADRLVRELLDAYTFEAVLPHVIPALRGQLQVFVYTRRPPTQANLRP